MGSKLYGLVILVVYLISTFYLLIKKKSILSLTIVYLILNPQIKIFNLSFRPLYALVLYLIILIIISKSKIKFSKKLIPYLLISFFNLIYYIIITTIINSGNLNNSGISSIIGFTISLMFMILLFSYFNKELYDFKYYDLAFKILVLVNVIGIILQSIYGAEIRTFFEELYLTPSYRYYSSLSNNMVYNRKFGFCSSPMNLGLLSLLTLNYFYFRKNNCTNYLLFIFLSFINGLMSLSKTFILGVPLILIIELLVTFFFKKGKVKISKNIKKYLKFIIAIPIFILIGSLIYNYMVENTTISYYLKMLGNPLQSLETRYGNQQENILLFKTFEILERHWLFGVGLQSINGEFIGDSTYIMALHHGGIFSLMTIIIFYIVNLITDILKCKKGKLSFDIIWIISGLAMPTFFTNIIIFPFLYAFYVAYEND